MAENTVSAAPIVSEFAGEADMIELIEMFVDGLPAQVQAMLDAVRKNDIAAIAVVAHQLKGAGGGYGYPALTDVAKSLEFSAKAASDVAAIKSNLDAVVAMCDRVKAGLKQ